MLGKRKQRVNWLANMACRTSKICYRDLNDARKSQAYGDVAAPELDAEEVVCQIENYAEAVEAFRYRRRGAAIARIITLSVFRVVSLISPFTRSTLLQRSVATSASLYPV
jgi:hypothetical protein